MDCMICGKTMETKEFKGVEIDYCPKCGGVWLERGELEDLSGLDLEKARRITCNKCQGEMSTRVISDVEIDYCPKCGNVWLDKGEMEKLSGINPKTGRKNILYEFLNQEFPPS